MGTRAKQTKPRINAGVCRVCGCTDADCSECVDLTGEGCSWVEPDLCSACEPIARLETQIEQGNLFPGSDDEWRRRLRRVFGLLGVKVRHTGTTVRKVARR